MLESKIKSKQREDFAAKGWVFVQVGNDAPTGFPDTLVLSPTGYSCYVEWKQSKSAHKRPLQKFWHQKLIDMGHDAFFVYPENINEWRQEVLQKGGR